MGSYTLVGQMDTKEYNCLNDCIYQKKEEPGTKYCFAVGDQQVECKDGPPMGGSPKPPMEGSKPPMEGSKAPMEGSKPPMEGSKPPLEGSKPPMEGSSKPETGTTGAPGTVNSSKVVWPLKTSPVTSLPKFTTVFGMGVFGASSVTDVQFQHVASVLAEWLDNDEDGCVDNPLVLTKLVSSSPKASIVVPGKDGSWTDTLFLALEAAGYINTAPLYTGETLPACAGPAATSQCADASLEEIWHVITSLGYAKAWPGTFGTGQTPASKLTQAMDVARGGKFLTPPITY